MYASLITLLVTGSLTTAVTWQEESGRIFNINHNLFKIPIAVDERAKTTLKELRLFVSSDKGKSWKQAEKIGPKEVYFMYQAPKDGEYWFGVQTVDKNGVTNPARTTFNPPDLKVRVKGAQQAPALQKQRPENLRREIERVRTDIKDLKKRFADTTPGWEWRSWGEVIAYRQAELARLERMLEELLGGKKSN